MTDDPLTLGLRLKCLELVAAGVTAGRVHPNDAYGLARLYFDFVTDAPLCDCDDETVTNEVMVAAAAKRRH